MGLDSLSLTKLSIPSVYHLLPQLGTANAKSHFFLCTTFNLKISALKKYCANQYGNIGPQSFWGFLLSPYCLYLLASHIHPPTRIFYFYFLKVLERQLMLMVYAGKARKAIKPLQFKNKQPHYQTCPKANNTKFWCIMYGPQGQFYQFLCV